MNIHEQSITLLLPVKDEIGGLKAILPRIDLGLFTQVLVVDGNSVDGSVEYVKQFPQIEVVVQKRPGLAEAIVDAYPDIKGDYVITFSPDGNSIPELLPTMIEKINEGCDLVVASRYLPPAKSDDDDPITAIGNFMFTKLISMLGKTKITDSLNIYRGYKKDFLINPEMGQFVWGPVLEPLISAYATVRGLKIVEFPGDEPVRIGGTRKMRIIYNGFCILVMLLRMYAFRMKLFFNRKQAFKTSKSAQ